MWSDEGLEWESFASIKELRDYLFIQSLIMSTPKIEESGIHFVIKEVDQKEDQ